MKYSPQAPQGPPDTYQPNDPALPPFGGSGSILQGMVSGYGDSVSGPLMNTDKAQTVTMRAPRSRAAGRIAIGLKTRGY